jgi:hypothetical protein
VIIMLFWLMIICTVPALSLYLVGK